MQIVCVWVGVAWVGVTDRQTVRDMKNSKANTQIIPITFFQFHGTICLELTAGHSKKCTNIISVQISLKTFLVWQTFQ